MCIKLHFHLVILAIYFYAIHRIKIFFCFYIFAIIHELAHITMAAILKVRVEEIMLLPVGVCAKCEYIPNRLKEISIAAAGPLFSSIIGLLINDNFMKTVNYVIAFLNLIPIYPLDGGKILRGTLSIILGHKKSIRVSSTISKVIASIIFVFSVVLYIYFKNFSLLLLSLYIYIILREETKKDRILETIRKVLE